ncbi:hypothetical protein LCGC14_1952240 [marine sediment metagenome]|uniref:FMN-binding domain-containing protein n=1 Tax=marine sediment metagenome TaxID=412755 RepID=A0A0F9FHC4_9ZZZZ
MQAVRVLFPTARRIREVGLPGPAPSRIRLRAIDGPRGDLGYLVDEYVVSRSGPFKIRVIMDSEFHVRRVTVLEYPGKRGWEVQRRSFTRQFDGKGPDDPIRVGQDVDAVTGATISSRATAEGVRRAIRVARAKGP